MRKGNWDFAKAVLMFLVIYGHVCPTISGDVYTEIWCALTRIIGLFVMPCFFFISGYFQSSITSSQILIQKYRKTFFRVGVPLMSWGGVYYISKILIGGVVIETDSIFKHIMHIVRSSILDITSFYWFFAALVICIAVGSLLSLLIQRKSNYGVPTLIISLLLFTCMKIDLFHFTFVWFYYGCGMLYKFYENKLRENNNKRLMTWTMAIATLVCMVVGFYFYPKYSFYYTSNLIWKTNFLFILLRYLLCLFASICALYWFFQFYKRHKEKPFVVYLTQSGQDTLFLYGSHVLILSLFLKHLVESHYYTGGLMSMPFIRYYVVSPILSVLIYYILYSLAKYLKNFSLFRVLFLGLPAR